MLQIKFITILIVLIISAYPEERGQNIPVWMFEDALSEKPLKIDAASITSPENLAEAAEKYSNGEYSLAFEELQKVHELHLYTGKADIATIMLAEIARLLGMKHKAYQYYRYIIDYFPESRKSPAACYRILQLASEERDSEQADSMFSIIQNRYRSHPLYKYAVFSLGKLYFLSERYGEARELLNELDKDFKWINRARYIAALADIQLNNKKKALLTCNRILNESVNDTLVSEVSVLIGDIYFEDEKYETALEYYRQVPEWSTKADYSKIKEVKCCINLKRYDAGAEIAEDYINDNGKNFFEMASVLRNIYKEQDNKREE